MSHYPCLLRNVSRRPLELHSGKEVRVISPGEAILVEKPDAEFEALERKGALSRHAPPPAPKKEDPKPQPKAATGRSAKPTRRKARHKGDRA